MRLKRYKYIIAVIVSSVTCLSGCKEETEFIANDNAEIKIETAIHTGSVTSRTRVVATIQDYVGRGVDIADSDEKEKDFESGDLITLTSIKRTANTIPNFTYSNISFKNAAGSWSRIAKTGQTVDPDSRIYWSDAENAHTFIGYSLPDEAFESKWVQKEQNSDIYYSCIGDPVKNAEQEVIDFASEWNQDGTLAKDGNEKIKKEDLLLTHDLNKKAERGGSVAKLYFYHALANVRIIVDIRGFSASADAMDTQSRVYDLILKDMPVMYKWRQQNANAEPLTGADDLPTGSTWTWNLTKDIKTWQPHPEGTGTNAERVFTFYALAVPGTTNLVMPFKVKYPKPLNPTDTQEKTYTATINGVELKAGFCTTINISLNHSNEVMTVGATYIDWEFKESPDHGTLRKNSVFLEDTDRSKLTIVGDEKATIDDAVWLYNEMEEITDAEGNLVTQAKREDGKLVIKDIYGHTGDTEADAYQISTAQQLLSFAYEVSGGNSTTGRQTQNGVTATDFTNGGMDFSGKYIKLDADIILQPNRNSTSVTWIGVGDVNESDETNNPSHAFNGTFLGGGRIISKLMGSPFFMNLGSSAKVEYLSVQDIVNIGSGTGALVESNAGDILSCKVQGNVSSTSSNNVGGIVGTNTGNLTGCYHLGMVAGTGNVAGIVGTNGTGGTIDVCYDASALSKGGEGSAYGIAASNSGTIYNSYYNTKLTGSITGVAPEEGTITNSGGKTTVEMQKEEFASLLNTAWNSSQYKYVYHPAEYPTVTKK